ncbi:unnamed protein product [Phaedon cochleariae]|uniref:Uncharacterized protein n=1 Tax=Phaedon cochleariae TaxID=80249 RepID=A0A9N9SHY5_PHACE|nr:unnamed protein product [Phaedon cochleariae]
MRNPPPTVTTTKSVSVAAPSVIRTIPTRSVILPATDDNVAENYVVIPPDGGWGWVVVAVAFICYFIIDGTTYTFGIFLTDISKTFEVHPTRVALINSLLSGFTYFVVSTLKVNDLKILKKEFSDVNETKFELLTRKGVFPYDYVDNVERLDESELPSIQNFYNKLNDTNISDDDYAHAQKVWESFELKSLGEYSDLYMRTDILLLADVMENFRASSLKTYGLDPAWYYTMPGYTWDCMLKYTGCKLQIIKDIDMVMFVEQAIRGGVSVCCNRTTRSVSVAAPSVMRTIPTRSVILPATEDDVAEHYVVIPPDGGWGWVVVAVAFVCNFIIDGTTYTFGIFLTDISKTFEEEYLSYCYYKNNSAVSREHSRKLYTTLECVRAPPRRKDLETVQARRKYARRESEQDSARHAYTRAFWKLPDYSSITLHRYI